LRKFVSCGSSKKWAVRLLHRLQVGSFCRSSSDVSNRLASQKAKPGKANQMTLVISFLLILILGGGGDIRHSAGATGGGAASPGHDFADSAHRLSPSAFLASLPISPSFQPVNQSRSASVLGKLEAWVVGLFWALNPHVTRHGGSSRAGALSAPRSSLSQILLTPLTAGGAGACQSRASAQCGAHHASGPD